jgi:hypothetical protein
MQGFTKFGVLAPPEWLQEANAVVEALEKDRLIKRPDEPHFNYREGVVPQADRLLAWMEANIVRKPPVVDWLDTLLGRNWHIDQYMLHSQCGERTPGPPGLHGPSHPYDPRQMHTCLGQPRETMVVVSLSLVDVELGMGGLVVVPGSHHNTMPFPDEWNDLSQWPHHTPYPVHQVTVKAGGVALFGEALRHGTPPWHGTTPRRTLFIKCAREGIFWTLPHDKKPLLAQWAEDRRELLVEAGNG